VVIIDELGRSRTWYVCIVRKGQPAASAQEAVFVATSMKGEKVLWRQARLLEVQYDSADILEFENLWGSTLQQFSIKDPYWIEIRLAPTSPDFSNLTPDGGFR